MKTLAVVRVYRQPYINRTAAKSLVSYLRPLTLYILGRQQCSAFDGMQSTRTTAQVASFESMPMNLMIMDETGKYLQVGTLILVFAKRYHMNLTGTAIACLINNMKLAQILSCSISFQIYNP